MSKNNKIKEFNKLNDLHIKLKKKELIDSCLNIDSIKELLFLFKEQELPDAEEPFHPEAEIWCGFKRFMDWLSEKDISKSFRFYKEFDNRWYVDLPDYEGEKSELEMVLGADTMLDFLCEGNNEVSLFISDREFDNCNKLEFKGLATDLNNGAYYMLNNYNGISTDFNIWLCDVTKFVFGYFPETIFFNKI